MVAVAFLLLQSLRIGASWLLTEQLQHHLDRWPTQAKATADLDEAAELLHYGLLITPDNPEHHADNARYWLTQTLAADLEPRIKSGYIEKAHAAIRQAIALKPVSRHAWALLLMIKREQHLIDEEFRVALARATQLGPWDPEVQWVVANVGLANWKQLPENEQLIVSNNLARGFKLQPKVMFAIAMQHRAQK